ncbi:MAG: Holliday junction branch migration protein RuvA [Thermus sp.]|uniref:Holliday junction branch migration protein RuvA n=1 Tax=Thermus sp. TaxID=275 RepID=UPI0025E597E9|nr:Holliday junction branch migration protein RuvA [Thermus sp.]MCS6869079.1 Holliday junction branch migration protein RuvA [Thermus sp.]MCS7217803.1 Holliday junction branch migration protein RuvA [Thermus sp.]MCX7849592.1 Holliday junction branch migration protein RuvA [Thermus sp.]MDW8016621.1 Holliday junction branch migration protein RuvA [Thermus sp.]MDW8356520.1 Holliday junction branch migration protein RuvA [Thermus sp.]
MVRYLKGVVLRKGEGSFLLLVGGVGFQVQAPPPFVQGLREGEEVAVHTHLQLKEEGLALYGFPEEESLSLFELLLSVNGVGPKAALSLLSALPPRLLAQALAEGDVRLLTSASGVGRKLAERIALELKGKVPPHLAIGAKVESAAAEEAVLALAALGFKEGQARAVVLDLLAQNPGAKAQELIKEALKRLR